MNATHYNHQKLKALREARGWAQSDVAKRVDCDRQTIYRLEKGTQASYELLCQLAALYALPVTDLLHPFPMAQAA